MIASPDVQLSAGASCADSEKENNFDPCTKSCHDQKFGVNENNVAYDKDTPQTLPLDDLSLVESDLDLNISSDHDQDSDAKGRADLEVGPISTLDETDSTQHENSMTTITPILVPGEHALERPAPDVERGIVASSATNNESSESQTRVDNSYTVTWSVVASRGEKMCGTTLPRFFWLAVLLGLLAVLCASVGYLMHSLRMLE